MKLPHPEIRVISSISGIKIGKFVQNPQKLNWGCVMVVKDRSRIIIGSSFSNQSEKENALLMANNTVFKQKNSSVVMNVHLVYGIKLNEYIGKYGYTC